MLVDDDDAFVAKPDDPSVAGDEAVFEAERLVRVVGARVGGEHTLAVVRVEQAREQVRLRLPFLDGVAEERLDLPARKDVRADLIERVDIDHERQLLDQGPVTASDVVQRRRVVAPEINRHRRHSLGIGLFGGSGLPRTGYRTALMWHDRAPVLARARKRFVSG